MTAEVEYTLNIATEVDTLTEAWTFIMEHVDGLDRPAICIRPCSRSEDGGVEWVQIFEVELCGRPKDKA